MENQKYIDQAVTLALQNVEDGGKPFGAVIVKGGKVVATGVNKAAQTGDLTSHAEMEAIRKATQKRGEGSLKGATLYASGHPCPMCLSAIYLAGISEVYFSSDLDAAAEAGLGVSDIYKELKRDPEDREIALRKVKPSILKSPLQIWSNKEQ
ncbi:nucleoside deaminase [Fodinibius salsisoli]|uniref:Nucleoside deaminase n=1 Tax=Fodinibius salsisoli TaxID=2820877 RepID=A0ABT3PQ76_9BACT|nr:nucleoside deaminase [Fodinibius salsisoli]MCW9707996.1 nucleoside deaminase [Fodinibius salsisoli]